MALTWHLCRASTCAELCKAAVPGVQGQPDASHPAAHGLPVLYQAPRLLALCRPDGPLPLDCCGAGLCAAVLWPSWKGERWLLSFLPADHSWHATFCTFASMNVQMPMTAPGMAKAWSLLCQTSMNVFGERRQAKVEAAQHSSVAGSIMLPCLEQLSHGHLDQLSRLLDSCKVLLAYKGLSFSGMPHHLSWELTNDTSS